MYKNYGDWCLVVDKFDERTHKSTNIAGKSAFNCNNYTVIYCNVHIITFKNFKETVTTANMRA